MLSDILILTLLNTGTRINIEYAIFNETTDEFHVKAAPALDKKCKVLGVEFE